MTGTYLGADLSKGWPDPPVPGLTRDLDRQRAARGRRPRIKSGAGRGRVRTGNAMVAWPRAAAHGRPLPRLGESKAQRTVSYPASTQACVPPSTQFTLAKPSLAKASAVREAIGPA